MIGTVSPTSRLDILSTRLSRYSQVVMLESAHQIQLFPEHLQQHTNRNDEGSERPHVIQGTCAMKLTERMNEGSSEWPVRFWGVNLGKGMWWDIKRRAPYYW